MTGPFSEFDQSLLPIHVDPSSKVGQPPFTAAQMQAIGTALIDGILAQVLLALANVQIIGNTTLGDVFPQLQQWAQDLEQQAQDALTGANTANTNMDTHLNNMVAWFQQNGTAPSVQQTVSDAENALATIASTVQGLSSKVQSQLTGSIGASQSGKSYQVMFAQYQGSSPSPAPFSLAPFTTTYTGSGTGELVLSGGDAVWQAVNNGDVSVVGIYNGGVTDTDYQELQATIAGFPNGAGSRNYGLVHANSTGDTYVYGVIYLSPSLTLNWEVGCYVSGVQHVFDNGTHAPFNYNFTLVAGVGGDPYRFQGIAGDTVVFDYTDSAHTSQAGSSYRHWGFRSDTANGGQTTPASASYVGCADNSPPDLVGSGGRAYCSSSTAVSGFTGMSTFNLFPAGFFDTTTECTPDLSFAPLTSVPYVVIGKAGWYQVDIRCDMQFSASLGLCSICPALERWEGGPIGSGGSLVETKLTPSTAVAFNVSGAALADSHFGSSVGIYCEAGDYLYPGYWIDGVGTVASLHLLGEASGAHSYMSIQLSNWSLN